MRFLEQLLLWDVHLWAEHLAVIARSAILVVTQGCHNTKMTGLPPTTTTTTLAILYGVCTLHMAIGLDVTTQNDDPHPPYYYYLLDPHFSI